MKHQPRGISLLLAGHIVSTFGSSIYVVTLVLYLAEITDSPRVLGLLQFFAYLPAALLGPLAGAAVDTWNRTRTIVATDLIRAGIMVATAVFGLFVAAIPAWMLVAATVGVSLCGVFFVPAVHAIVPDLVRPDRLKRVNGLRSALNQIANLAGSAAGGLLYLTLGAPLLILLNGASFLLSGLWETAIRPTAITAPPDPPEPLRARVRAGLALLVRERGLRALVVVQAATNLLLPPLVVALPFVVVEIWGLSADFFGYLFAAVLAGGVTGFILFSGVRTTARLESGLYRGGLPAIAVAIATLGWLATPAGATTRALVPLLFAAMAVAGAAVGTMYMIGVTRIQRAVAPSLRGRVFATLEMLTAVALPAAYLASGLLVDALRDRPALIFATVAAAAALLALAVAANRDLGRLLGATAADPTPTPGAP